MASMSFGKTGLKNLREKAARLLSAAESLPASFHQEAVRLQRSDWVACLVALRSSVLEKVEREISSEASAKLGDSSVRAVVSVAGLVGQLFAKGSGDVWLANLSQRAIDAARTTTPPFGMVVVCIGPGGLPEDVDVLRVSSLARRSKREENASIDKLKKQGYFLLTPEAFSRLIDKLVNEITAGNVSLPVSVNELDWLQAPVPPTPGAGRLTRMTIEPMPAPPRDE